MLGLFLSASTFAGEIPGVPSQLPPFLQPDLEVSLSNDFFGRGGISDDFRTQQFSLVARLDRRWVGILDHSVLTLDNHTPQARSDQLSASVGYFLLNRSAGQRSTRIALGGGLRKSGRFGGEALQNGFHRLIRSPILDLPYVDASETEATVWGNVEHYRNFGSAGDSGTADWRFGYWLRATALATSDGQLDGAAAAFAVASKNSFAAWVGMRSDWRSGYDDPVFRETADQEDDSAVVVGLRLGPVVFETTQQFHNDSSYGQLRLISSGYRAGSVPAPRPRYSIEVSLLMPDVQARVVGKRHSKLLVAEHSRWRESVLLDIRYGEPQFEDDPGRFVHTGQLGLGLEWERPLGDRGQWMTYYGSAGAAWRNERLVDEDPGSAAESETIGRGVLTLDSGLRFQAARLSKRWNFRIQLGLAAWIPLSDARLDFGGEMVSLQEPAWGMTLGVVFDHD